MLDMQPAVPDSVVRKEEGTLNAHDQAILANLINPGLTDVAVPDTIDPAQLYNNLTVCIRAVNYFAHTSTKVKPLIGRMLRMIQDRPEIYKGLGYRTFDDFLTKGVQEKLGLSRSSLFECKQIADKWPSLTLDQYSKIGASKLAIISRFSEEGSPMARKMLDRAEKMSLGELRTWAEEKKLIESGETNAAVITIATNRAIANEWYEALNNPQVVASVGSDKPGEIFRSMLQESLREWLTVEQNDPQAS